MATTAVLSILSETTTPSRTLRLLRFSVPASGAASAAAPGAASAGAPGAASVTAPGAASVAVSVSVSSAISALPLGRFDLPQAQEGVDPRDLAAHLKQARGVVQLSRDVLEAQGEGLL